jgi:hypothetical protein
MAQKGFLTVIMMMMMMMTNILDIVYRPNIYLSVVFGTGLLSPSSGKKPTYSGTIERASFWFRKWAVSVGPR